MQEEKKNIEKNKNVKKVRAKRKPKKIPITISLVEDNNKSEKILIENLNLVKSFNENLVLSNENQTTVYKNITTNKCFSNLSNKITDKTEEFKNELNQTHFFYNALQPYTIGKKWTGMLFGPIEFRKNLSTIKLWKKLFLEFYEMEENDDLYVCGFMDINSFTVGAHIIVFDPKLIKIIDQEIANVKKKEDIQFLKSSFENDKMNVFE